MIAALFSGGTAMTDTRIEATLALRGDGFAPVGRERIAMLEAIIEQGSISGAARAVGYSYKAVWDAIAAINNLLPRPAVTAQAGGARGGSAQVTEEGLRLIRDFRRLEERWTQMSAALTGTGGTSLGQLWWSVGMKTSARNVFRCEVAAVVLGPVNVEVTLAVAEGAEIVAIVTRTSAEELRLEPGREVMALVKSSFVLVATGADLPPLSIRNRLKGVVGQRIDGAVNSDITIDLGAGKTLTAVVTRVSADALGLTPGEPVWALFDAAHVILIGE
jgi:molybdate transport system regulatory protein